MDDYASYKEFQALQDTYLKTLYRLCKGQFFGGIHFAELRKEIKFSHSDDKRVFEYLLQKQLVRLTAFQMVTVTEFGIEKVEREMAKSYEEQEHLVLKALFEKTKDDDVDAADLAKLIPIPANDIYYILKDFLRKGWVDENYEDTARITDLGVTAFHKWERITAPIVRDVYHTNIHGTSINQIGGQGNTQKIQLANNPEFDKAIGSIIELLKASSLSEDDKQEAINDAQAIGKLALNNPENAFERAKLKITAIETIVKGTELAVKLTPYWPVIVMFFESLKK